MFATNETAWLIGTAYVAGLALLGIVMTLRRRAEVGGDAFPSLLGAIAEDHGMKRNRPF